MATEILMPALSPTMEEGTLAKWLVKEGDTIQSGDILAEIETDKATMEFEAIDEGVISQIVVAEGTDNVAVGAVIAVIAGEDGDASAAPAPASKAAKPKKAAPPAETAAAPTASLSPSMVKSKPPASTGDRVIASPLAKRIAEQNGVDLAHVTGTGPNGRIVKADVAGAPPTTAAASAPIANVDPGDIPHSTEKLSNMRKTIARRLTESKQQVPHIYLTVDINLDKMLALRSELNAALEPQGIKLSVNDLLIKALAKALEATVRAGLDSHRGA